MSGHKIDSARDALSYILAGRATVTIKSLRTDEHLTFQVKRPKNEQYGITHFVQVRTGNDYARIGLIRSGRFEYMRKADLPADSKEVRGFAWLVAALNAGAVPPTCEVWHEGRCGMCARPLTDPTSIARGIGPDCFTKIPKCEAT